MILAATSARSPARRVDWLAIAPELALGGAAVLDRAGAGAAAPPARRHAGRATPRRRRRHHRRRHAVLAVAATCSDDGPITTMRGMVRVDAFGVFLGVVVLAATAMSLLVAVGVPATRRARGRRVRRRSCCFSAMGMLVMTTANDLIVVFLALEILSIPLYVLAAYRPPPARVAGSRHQVLRPRRVLVGDLPLRHRARVRRHRHHVAHRHRRRSSRQNTLFEQGTLLAGLGLLLVGLGFKVVGGAVPHVDARRLPGRAHAGHRVHGRGHQGRRVRRPAARVHGRVPAVPRRLAPDGVGARRALAPRGQHRRGGPVRHRSGCSRTRRSPTPATC